VCAPSMAPPGAPACRAVALAQARTCRPKPTLPYTTLPYPTLPFTYSACLQSGGARAGENLPPAAAAAGSWLALEGSRSSSAPSSAETEPLLGGGGAGAGATADGGARSGLARAVNPGGRRGGAAGAGPREPRARDGSGSAPGHTVGGAHPVALRVPRGTGRGRRRGGPGSGSGASCWDRA